LHTIPPAPRPGSVVTLSLSPGRLRRSPLAALALLLGLTAALPAQRASAQQALFGASEVEQQRFVLVAAPIGSSGSRYQLNIYEQVNDRRPCFATSSTLPAPVNPLLATFDFTGICGRYIDANGYSLRVGGTDLATSYRLMVRTDATGTLLLALPTKSGAGPEMIVARSGGPISGFHKLEPEPGWRLMRRTYGGRRLGHLYVYNDTWPVAATGEATPAAGSPSPERPAGSVTPSPTAAGTPSPAASGPAGSSATVGTPGSTGAMAPQTGAPSAGGGGLAPATPNPPPNL
jgi:hypothetical protein